MKGLGNSIASMFATVLVVVGIAASHAQAAPHGMYRTFKSSNFAATVPGRADAKLLYYGGPVISNAKVYAVMWGKSVNANTQNQIGGFLQAIVNSTHMDWLNEYATNITAVDGRQGTNQTIGRGAFAGNYGIIPRNTKTALEDKEIQAELEGQIAAGVLPKPDSNTLFMVYFPPGVSITIENAKSCQQFCAYHEGFTSRTFGNVFYGVMPDLGGACSFGCGSGGTMFDNLTAVSSHEFVEAITDPFPTPGDKPAYPQAWNTTDGQEIGDLCAGNNTTLSTRSGQYTIQQEFQNSIGQCAAGPYQSSF